MTIPSLISSYKEKVVVNTLSEVYSILSQAYKMSIEDNGPISTWNLTTNVDDSRVIIIEKFVPYMKHYSMCDNVKTKCKESVMIRDLLGKNANSSLKYNMIIGNTIKININDRGNYSTYLSKGDCNGDAGCFASGIEGAQALIPNTIMVNVTGKTNKPRWGEDLFLFAILDRGIVPYGDVGWAKTSGCNPERPSTAGWWSGGTCAGYVLKHKNLNYLRCVKGDKKYCTGNYAP